MLSLLKWRRLMKKKDDQDKSITRQMQEKTVGYITAALGLVAGLAWNDAIRAVIDAAFPMQRSGVIAKITYASVMTIVVVVIGFYLAKLISSNIIQNRLRPKNRSEKK